MTIVGLHLRHGVSSSLQSLGLMPERWTRAFLWSGIGVAILVGAGFLLIPVYVYLFVQP
jgi:succinate dehydrogenase / fumarate reductase cytochrome b subunit